MAALIKNWFSKSLCVSILVPVDIHPVLVSECKNSPDAQRGKESPGAGKVGT